MVLLKKRFLFNDIKKIKGVGPQISKYLKKRKLIKLKILYLICLIRKQIDQR